MILGNCAPSVTAINDVKIRAQEAPKNTERGDLLSADKLKVASCVLSANSARKIATKVLNKILKSMTCSLLPFKFL